MKRISSWGLLLGMLAVLTMPITARAAGAAASKTTDKSPAAAVAVAVSTVTGIAISPLLGTGAYGAYQYFAAEPDARPNLPWYAQIHFWLPALLLVGGVAAKDALGAALPPGWKKPLDVLETVENKVSGLVAAGAVVPLTMAGLSRLFVNHAPASAWLESSGTASIYVASMDWSWLLNILTVPIGIAIFLIVWMASHAINVLILLSPWGAIDAALKSARTALLGLLTISAALNPWVAGALSIVLVFVAYLVAGWSFRLTIFGTIFSWDFFTLAKYRRRVSEEGNKFFSSSRLVKQGVPMRTWGRLVRAADSTEATFTYRPWLVLPARAVSVDLGAASVGKGFFFSTLRDAESTFFVLPPRYRGHEEKLVEIYRLAGVEPAGLLKAWSSLRELFGGGAAKAQVM